MDYERAYQELYSLRQSTAEVLAAAVTELYPNIEIKGAKVDQSGFSYTFVFPDFMSSFLEPIERKMKEIIQEKRSIEVKTMVYASAKGYLSHIGIKRKIQPEREHTFVEIGEFIDLASEYQIDNTGEIKYFLLTGAEKRDHSVKERSIVEISGTSFLDKESFKAFKKTGSGKIDHSSFLLKETFLNEKGVVYRDLLFHSWRSLLKREGFSLFQTLSPCTCNEYDKISRIAGSEISIEKDNPIEKNVGLFDVEVKTISKEIFSTGEVLTSYLHSAIKWLKLLELDHFSLFLFTSKKKKYEDVKKVLTNLSLPYLEKEAKGEERLCLFIEDKLGRAWKVFELEKNTHWTGKILSFERVLALLEEKKEDFWKRVVAQIDLYE